MVSEYASIPYTNNLTTILTKNKWWCIGAIIFDHFYESLRLIVTITRSKNYLTSLSIFCERLDHWSAEEKMYTFCKWFPEHIEPLHSGKAFWCRFIGAFPPRSGRVLTILTLKRRKDRDQVSLVWVFQGWTNLDKSMSFYNRNVHL